MQQVNNDKNVMFAKLLLYCLPQDLKTKKKKEWREKTTKKAFVIEDVYLNAMNDTKEIKAKYFVQFTYNQMRRLKRDLKKKYFVNNNYHFVLLSVPYAHIYRITTAHAWPYSRVQALSHLPRMLLNWVRNGRCKVNNKITADWRRRRTVKVALGTNTSQAFLRIPTNIKVEETGNDREDLDIVQ